MSENEDKILKQVLNTGLNSTFKSRDYIPGIRGLLCGQRQCFFWFHPTVVVRGSLWPPTTVNEVSHLLKISVLTPFPLCSNVQILSAAAAGSLISPIISPNSFSDFFPQDRQLPQLLSSGCSVSLANTSGLQNSLSLVIFGPWVQFNWRAY